jgi:hypothetical protein
MAFDPITAAFSLGEKLVDRFFPDPIKKAEALFELEKMRMNGDLAVMASQAKINEIEAGSSNLFVAGWRPGIGWICALGFAMQTVIGPTLTWLSSLLGRAIPFPQLDTSTLSTVLMGMLGLAGMRTYEKMNGISKG